MPKHFIVTIGDEPSLTTSNEQLVKAIREVLGCYFIPTVEVSDITVEVEGQGGGEDALPRATVFTLPHLTGMIYRR